MKKLLTLVFVLLSAIGYSQVPPASSPVVKTITFLKQIPPSNPDDGELYWDSVQKQLFIYDDALPGWKPVGEGGDITPGTDDQVASEVPVSPTVNSNGDVQSVLEDHESRIDALTAGGSDGVITNISLAGNNLTTTGTGGAFVGSVDLSSFLDNTDSQTLSLTGNDLSISNGNTLSLSGYLDNTDDQALTLSGNSLILENGGTVNLAPILLDWSTPVNANVIPDANGTRDLGSPANQFFRIYTQNITASNSISGDGSAITSLVASNMNTSDAGGYFSSTDAEGTFQEIGLSLSSSLTNPLTSDLDLNQNNVIDVGSFGFTNPVGGFRDWKIEMSDHTMQFNAEVSPGTDTYTTVATISHTGTPVSNTDLVTLSYFNANNSSGGLTPSDIGAVDKTLTQSDFSKHNYTDDTITLTLDNSPAVGSVAIFQSSDQIDSIMIVPDAGVTIFGNGTGPITEGLAISQQNAVSIRKMDDNLYSAIGYFNPFTSVPPVTNFFNTLNAANPENETAATTGTSGSFITWTQGTPPDPAPAGTIALRAEVTTAGARYLNNEFTIDPADVGKTFDINIDVIHSAGNTGQVSILAQQTDGWVASVFGTTSSTTGNTWQSLPTISAVANATTLKIVVFFQTASIGDVVWIDNIRITEQ